VDALFGRPSFQAGIRLMRGGPSEVGKVELGHIFVERTTVARKKGIHLP